MSLLKRVMPIFTIDSTYKIIALSSLILLPFDLGKANVSLDCFSSYSPWRSWVLFPALLLVYCLEQVISSPIQTLLKKVSQLQWQLV